jgi:hypothetical protein
MNVGRPGGSGGPQHKGGFGNSTFNNDMRLDAALKHVRELHQFFAELRSKNFDFFLILLGAAAGAIVTQNASSIRLYAAVAAAIICVVFFGLDARTIEMIADARRELEKLEPQFNVNVHRVDSWADRAKRPFVRRLLECFTPRLKGRLSFISHKVMYRAVFVLGYLASIAIIWFHPLVLE